jgi:hypothetical protein
MWPHVIEFVAELGDDQFRIHEVQIKASPYGLIRRTFDRLRPQRCLRSLSLDNFVEVVGNWTDSLALCCPQR